MKPENLTKVLIITLFVLLNFQSPLFSQSGNIIAPIGTPQIPSDYVDTSIPDDPVFIFCSPDSNGDPVLGQLSVIGGYANCTYQWGLYDPNPASGSYQQFVPFQTGPVPTGPSSTITDLESGFYQVIITCNQGLPSESTSCSRAHVFVNNTILNFDPIAAGCNPFNITGGIINPVSDFTIYDPPATPFVVDASTSIEVCFWADHSFVSDLGFYLYGPSGGRVDLLPPVSAWNQGSQVTSLDISVVTGCSPSDYYTNCNSGNNLVNFCFTSDLPAGNPNYTPCICDMPTPLTGTFASCEGWSDIYGDSASQGGWSISIFDCFPADVGSLQRVTLSFEGQGQCGQTTFIYDSGPINETINDGACDSTTAAIYNIPLKTTENHTITNEVSAEWSTYPTPWNPAWGSQIFDPVNMPVINPEPLQSTYFCLTVFDHLYDTLGNEIINYVPCEPQVCQVFETLPVDPTIINPPYNLCANSSPVQLTPLFYGGAWTSTCGLFDPSSNTGCITGGGIFFPDNAFLGPNEICYAFGGICAADTCITINVVSGVEIANVTESCNSMNTHFQVCFDMVIYNPGAFSIIDNLTGLPFPGSMNGNQWCSNWLPNGTAYSIIATDNNNCDAQLINGIHTCNCTTDAGEMPQNLIEVCAYDPATSVAQSPGGIPSWTLDANDGFEYYLHSDPYANLGTIIGHNTTGTFIYNPLMTYGETYYISQVVGNNIGTPTSHVVDLTDICLSVAPGTPVIWYELPTANAGSNNFVCGLSIPLNADSVTLGVGVWSCPSSTGIIWNPSSFDPNAIATVPLFDTNQYGCELNTEYTFRWTVTNGPCQIYDDVIMTFKPQPIAFAGNDIIVCGLEADLNAEYSLCGPQGVSTGIWSGYSQITGMLDPNATVNEYNPGTYTYSWTEWNDECTSEDYVTVTYISQPFADAGYNDSVCGYNYNLSAISTMGTGLWTGPLGSYFTNPTSPSTLVEVIYQPNQSEVVAVFTWTETNVLCSASDDVTIVFSKQPTALAGYNDWICGISYTFNANILGSEFAMGNWSTNFIGAVFDNSHNPQATITIPNTGSLQGQPVSGSFGDSSIVMIPFTWEINNNNCIDIDELIMTFYQIPDANAGDNSQICGKIYELNAEYSIGMSVGKWEMVSGPTMILPNFLDDTDPNTIVQVPENGEYIFEWKERNIHNPTCMSTDEVTIFFIEIPDTYAGPDKIACGNETYLEAVFTTDIGFWLNNQSIILDHYDPMSLTVLNILETYEIIEYIWVETNIYNGLQCITNDTVEITFVPVPELTILDLDSGNVELILIGGFPPYTLEWNNGATDALLYNLSTGTYIASVTDSWGCVTTDTIEIINPNSITDPIFSEDNLILFPNIPNPFSNETEFSFYIPGKTMVRLSIYDIIGNEIDVILFEELTKGKHQIKYSNTLPAGTYFYRLNTSNHSKTKKMVVIGR